MFPNLHVLSATFSSRRQLEPGTIAAAPAVGHRNEQDNFLAIGWLAHEFGRVVTLIALRRGIGSIHACLTALQYMH